MLWNLTPYLKKGIEARNVSGVSLNGGLVGRSLHEAVKMKSRLFWRAQDFKSKMPESWDTC